MMQQDLAPSLCLPIKTEFLHYKELQQILLILYIPPVKQGRLAQKKFLRVCFLLISNKTILTYCFKLQQQFYPTAYRFQISSYAKA